MSSSLPTDATAAECDAETTGEQKCAKPAQDGGAIDR